MGGGRKGGAKQTAEKHVAGTLRHQHRIDSIAVVAIYIQGCPNSPAIRAPSAAPPPAVRKASGFPAHAASFPPSAQAGRLNLPACAEEVVRDTRATERRSLSAQRPAEPQVAARRIERNLDKPDIKSPLRRPLSVFPQPVKQSMSSTSQGPRKVRLPYAWCRLPGNSGC